MPDMHTQAVEPTEDELKFMQARMNGYIFPNSPVTDEEKEAYKDACLFQIEHERKIKEALSNQTLPDGVTAFQIGHFSMQFQAGSFSSKLTNKTICDAAYGTLLRAGLLYRGVEGRCRPCL